MQVNTKSKDHNGNHARAGKYIDKMNNLVGSWSFLVIHVISFSVWLIGKFNIDILTMIVSLEAIALMILLLMAQNRQSKRDERKSTRDLNADLEALKIGKEILTRLDSIEKNLKK